MVVNKRGWLTRIFILTGVIILGLVSTSNAMEVRFRANNMLTVSDNIHRAPSGLEMSGSRLIMQGDLNLSGDLGAGSVDLDVGGGWETLKNGGSSDSDNYNFQLNVDIPWSDTGYLRGMASTADETEEPEITDISQVRVRTRTSELGLEIGKRATPTFSWRTALNNRTESRFDRDLDESRAELGWDISLDRKRQLTLDVGFENGTEDVDEDSWTGSSLSIDIRRRSDRVTTGGYRLEWEDQDLEKSNGTNERSDMVSAIAYYELKMSSGWSFTSELGVDGIKPIVDERSWEPRAEVRLSSALNRRVQLDGSLSTFSTIQDPLEDQVSWTRDSQVRAGLAWSVSRTYTVEPSVQFRYAELFGNGIPDRTDETFILRVGTRWIPARNWSVSLNGHTEERTSSQGSFDLSESRLELNFSGTFL
jgi:hypothetical protein